MLVKPFTNIIIMKYYGFDNVFVQNPIHVPFFLRDFTKCSKMSAT